VQNLLKIRYAKAPVARRALFRAWLAALALASAAAAQSPPSAPAAPDLPWTDCSGHALPALPAGTFRVTGVGDMVFSEDASANLGTFAPFATLLRESQFVFGNLEGAITSQTKSLKTYVPGRSYAFRFPPETAALLQGAGFAAVSVANNHAYDFGPEGYAEGMRLLAQHEVIATGGTRGAYDIVRASGRKVALIGVGFYPVQNTLLDPEEGAGMVRKARGEADLVLVAIHAGAEGPEAAILPPGEEIFLGESRGATRAYARAMIEAGADAVIGYGPHVVRAAECHLGRPILYSVGNFVAAGGLNTHGLPGIAAMGQVAFDAEGRFLAARVVPLAFSPERYPVPDPEEKALHVINYLGRLAQRQLPDFQPLVFQGNESAAAHAEAWRRTVMTTPQ